MWVRFLHAGPNNMAYQLHNPDPGAIAFHTGGTSSEEMIRIAADGFYVRGVRVPADEQEAQAVYDLSLIHI
jgi:hypothetical protein